MQRGGFIFQSVDLLSYTFHETILKRGKSYNKDNKDNKCFHYSITAALNNQNIKNHPEKFSNIKPLINQYN